MNTPNINNHLLNAQKVSLRHKQSGAVLILAMLIVALVAGLSIKFASDYQLGLARAEGRWYGAQARAYSMSGDGVAIKMMSNDSAPEYDAQGSDPWPEDFSVPVDGGTITVSVRAANGQLDLNSLVKNQLKQDKFALEVDRYDSSQRMFIRLLQLFPEIVHNPEEAIAILEAVVDWADGDDNPSGTGGAESNYYLGLADPYLPANMGFRSVEELQMVRGITPDLMRALRPYITVVDSGGGLNVNAMEPLLYRCINVKAELKPLDEAAAAALQPQQGQPYKQMAEFETAVSKVISNPTDLDRDNLTVMTNYFWLQTQADIGEQRRTSRSLLARGTPTFKVIRREEVY